MDVLRRSPLVLSGAASVAAFGMGVCLLLLRRRRLSNAVRGKSTTKRFPEECVFTLADGRQIGYTDCGDPRGSPLLIIPPIYTDVDFYSQAYGELFESHTIRAIVVPVYPFGRYDPKPGWKPVDFPGEICELLDFLGIAKISVCGMSGGTSSLMWCFPCRYTHRRVWALF